MSPSHQRRCVSRPHIVHDRGRQHRRRGMRMGVGSGITPDEHPLVLGDEGSHARGCPYWVTAGLDTNPANEADVPTAHAVRDGRPGFGPEVFRSGTLIDGLKKAVAERALDAEMEAHLKREDWEAATTQRAQPQAGSDGLGHHRSGGSAGPAGEVDPQLRGVVRLAAVGLRREGGLDVRARSDDAGDPRTRSGSSTGCRCRRNWSRRSPRRSTTRSGGGRRGPWTTSTRSSALTRCGRRSGTRVWCGTRRCRLRPLATPRRRASVGAEPRQHPASSGRGDANWWTHLPRVAFRPRGRCTPQRWLPRGSRRQAPVQRRVPQRA